MHSPETKWLHSWNVRLEISAETTQNLQHTQFKNLGLSYTYTKKITTFLTSNSICSQFVQRSSKFTSSVMSAILDWTHRPTNLFHTYTMYACTKWYSLGCYGCARMTQNLTIWTSRCMLIEQAGNKKWPCYLAKRWISLSLAGKDNNFELITKISNVKYI